MIKSPSGFFVIRFRSAFRVVLNMEGGDEPPLRELFILHSSSSDCAKAGCSAGFLTLDRRENRPSRFRDHPFRRLQI
jgi:hypothetical protein